MSQTNHPSNRPVLLSPTAGRPADAAMTHFSWFAPADHDARLQVGTDRTFETLVCDVPVTGMTHLTLEKAIPHLDQTYYWRVGREGAWSAPAAFVGATDDGVQRWERAQAETQVDAAREAQRQREQQPAVTADTVAIPFDTSSTSRAATVLWMLPVALSYLVVVYLFIRTVI